MENPDVQQTPKLNVAVSVSFPDSEVFGVKLVNGHATNAVLSIANQETTPVRLTHVGGSLLNQRTNSTLPATQYDILIPAGEKESATYSFAVDMHPQDLTLNLAAVFKDQFGMTHVYPAFNGTVSVVEAPTSFFDPQM